MPGKYVTVTNELPHILEIQANKSHFFYSEKTKHLLPRKGICEWKERIQKKKRRAWKSKHLR